MNHREFVAPSLSLKHVSFSHGFNGNNIPGPAKITQRVRSSFSATDEHGVTQILKFRFIQIPFIRVHLWRKIQSLNAQITST